MAGNIDFCVAWRRRRCQASTLNGEPVNITLPPPPPPAPTWRPTVMPGRVHAASLRATAVITRIYAIPTRADFRDRNNPRSCLARVHSGRAHTGVE